MKVFVLTLYLTQDQINLLGELLFAQEDVDDEAGSLYDLLVNAASAAGADLP